MNTIPELHQLVVTFAADWTENYCCLGSHFRHTNKIRQTRWSETHCMSLLFVSICIFLLRSKGLGALFSGVICNVFDHNCCYSRPILSKNFVVISISMSFGRRGFTVTCICGGSHEKLVYSFISSAQSTLVSLVYLCYVLQIDVQEMKNPVPLWISEVWTCQEPLVLVCS